MRFGVAVFAVLAGAGADGDGSRYEISATFTEGNRQSLALQLDAEQSFVVSSLGDGQAKGAGVELGDRLLSANGETADKKTNYWLISNVDKRPLDLVFRKGKLADKDCPLEQLALAYEYVEKGDILDLRRLLEEFKCDVNQVLEGQPPLIYLAATKGKIAPVKTLCFYGARLNVEVDGNGPIHIASELGHAFVVHVLIEEGAHLDKKNAKGLTPFQISALHGQTEPMKVLRKKCDWLAKAADGRTTEQIVQESGDEKVIDLMEKMLEEVRKKDDEKFQALLKGEEL